MSDVSVVGGLWRRAHPRAAGTVAHRTFATVLMCLLVSVCVAQPHAAADTSSATISAWSGHNDGATSTYSFRYTGPPHYFHVFIDSDNATTTGYRVGEVGADYMVESGILYRYPGSGGSWSWSRIGPVQASLTSSTAGYTHAALPDRRNLHKPCHRRLPDQRHHRRALGDDLPVRARLHHRRAARSAHTGRRTTRRR